MRQVSPISHGGQPPPQSMPDSAALGCPSVHTEASGSTSTGGSVEYSGNEQAPNQHAPRSGRADLRLMTTAKLPKTQLSAMKRESKAPPPAASSSLGRIRMLC